MLENCHFVYLCQILNKSKDQLSVYILQLQFTIDSR